jgi:flagellar hook-basal body complex protein FliE
VIAMSSALSPVAVPASDAGVPRDVAAPSAHGATAPSPQGARFAAELSALADGAAGAVNAADSAAAAVAAGGGDIAAAAVARAKADVALAVASAAATRISQSVNSLLQTQA